MPSNLSDQTSNLQLPCRSEKKKLPKRCIFLNRKYFSKIFLFYHYYLAYITEGFPGGSDKESTCNAGDAGLNPGLERSPVGEHGNPLQYSCLEKSMDRGFWQATVQGSCKELDMTEWLSMNAHPITLQQKN